MPLSTRRTQPLPDRPVPGLYLKGGAVVLVTRYHSTPMQAPAPAGTLQAILIEHEGDDTGRAIPLTAKEFEALAVYGGSLTLENVS